MLTPLSKIKRIRIEKMTINLVRYNCDMCGEEFEAACLSELQEKKVRHKCHLVNKRVERTAELKQSRIDLFVHDTTVNRLEEHNFDKLVDMGMIVHGS